MRGFTRALREDLLGRDIRVTTVDAGLVETEFSLVRFRGDAEQAKAVYEGTRPLSAEDVAECVLFAVTRPAARRRRRARADVDRPVERRADPPPLAPC